MAQIYMAKSFGAEGFVKPLVVKRLNPNLAAKTRFIDLFINEAKLLVTLNHGNIVPVFDFGRVGSDLYMAMEHVPGLSLGMLLSALESHGRRLGPELSAYIAAEICKGLDYAHRKTDLSGRLAGIVHRDIKPSNVLISSEGEVKIVDFGVAKLAGRLEGAEPLAGTLAYMSPEQAGQLHVDARTDLFSTGLVLHEMLTGRRVYGSESAGQTLALAREAVVGALPGAIPSELRVIVERATRKDPDQRFDSAHEMEQELSTFLVLHRSVSATLDGTSPRLELGALVRQAGQARPGEVTEGVGGSDADSADSVADSARDEDAKPVSAPSIRSALSMNNDPDLALLAGAAETFHSEFMTRVLKLPDAARRPRRFAVTRVAAVLGGTLALIGVGIVGWLWTKTDLQSTQPAVLASTAPSQVSAPQVSAQLARDAETARADEGQATRALAEESASGAATPARSGAGAHNAVGAADAQRPQTATRDAARRGPRARRSPLSRRAGRPRKQREDNQFGLLNLNAVPWARVVIDGQPVPNSTPLLGVKLRAGDRRIELVNPELGLRKTITVRIRPGITTWKVVTLE